MELIVIALFLFVSTISGQTTMPQCRCNQLNTCMQQEQQKMQTCAMSTQCMSLLGGNRNQVSSCLTQKMNRGQMMMDTCMKMKMANVGCTNSSNPMQVRSTMSMMNQQQPMMMTDRSAMGQFYSCVQNCMMSSGSVQQQMMNSPMMKSGMTCMQQLGCALDMNMLDMDMIVTTAQNCMMMGMPMTMSSNQNSMMMSSPAMMWLMPQDCTCLMNAGVQVMCNNMMNNNMMTNNNNMMMSNRGRRSNIEE